MFEEEKVGYAVWNIVNTWLETRSHLGGADFSRLNLMKVGFHNAFCYQETGNANLSAIFDQSLIEEKSFLPQGHESGVSSLALSPDGATLVSGSNDKTLKSWDLATGDCLATLVDIQGVLLAGCSLKKLHPLSTLSEESKMLMRQYGAILDEEDEERWKEAVRRAVKIVIEKLTRWVEIVKKVKSR